MNEQELRENIARIVAKHLCKNKYSHFQLYGDSANCYSRENFAECEAIADTVDALIAAGIGDVSEWKHRAKVAEEALQYAVSEYHCDECPCIIDCNVEIRGSQECIDSICEEYKKQAEKELQEERKDD